MLASTYGLAVVPHANEANIPNIHLLMSRPPDICPLAEWGVKLNVINQGFFKEFVQPEKGYFNLPKGPGFGMEFDPKKIVKKTEL